MNAPIDENTAGGPQTDPNETAEQKAKRQAVNLAAHSLYSAAAARALYPPPVQDGFWRPDPHQGPRGYQTIVNIAQSGAPANVFDILSNRYNIEVNGNKEAQDYIADRLGIVKKGAWRKNLVPSIREMTLKRWSQKA